MKRMLIIFLFLGLHASNISELTENYIYNFFGTDISLSKSKFIIPLDIKKKTETLCKQKFFSEYVYVWRIEQNGILKGYAVLDNVYGKTQPITFLVIFNIESEILSTTIIKYREQHGGAVQNQSWNDQFTGKNKHSAVTLGLDIDSISGATISSLAVTKGIKKLVMIFENIKADI